MVNNKKNIMNDEDYLISFEKEDDYYQISNKKIGKEKGFYLDKDVLVKYNGDSKKIVLSDKIKKIGKEAFKGRKMLEEIYIPNSVESIDMFAFENCKNLKKVYLSENIIELNSPFFNCNEDIYTIENGNYYLGTKDNPFYYLYETAKYYNGHMVINDNCKVILAPAFGYYEEYMAPEKIIFPVGLKRIDCFFQEIKRTKSNDYKNCRYFGSKNNPYMILAGVDSIYEKEYYIHQQCKFFDPCAFLGCRSLKRLIFKNDVYQIMHDKFIAFHNINIYCIGRKEKFVNIINFFKDKAKVIFLDDDGFGVNGFDIYGNHRNGTKYDELGYNIYGFDANGTHRNGTKYNELGYDIQGFRSDGYNKYGYDKNGYNRDGYDIQGYDRNGYNKDGYDIQGFNSNGRDKDGYDREGYDLRGFNRKGLQKNGYPYDPSGYDVHGYNRSGYDRFGFDKDGFNYRGYDRNGYNRRGFNSDGIHKNGTMYDEQGLDSKYRKKKN